MRFAPFDLSNISFREEEEDKLVAAMLKKKGQCLFLFFSVYTLVTQSFITVHTCLITFYFLEFHGESEQKKKAGKFKPMKVLKRLSTKGEGVKVNIVKKENK